MRQALLLRLAELGVKRYRWIFACAGILAISVIALFLLRPPRIQSDVLDLLPADDPIVRDFKAATQDFKSLDYLFILLKTDDPKGHPAQGYEGFADSMAQRLRKSPRVDGVEYRLQDYQGILQEMLPHTLLYLPPNDLGEVAVRFSDEGIREQVAKNRELLANPASFLTKDLIKFDPFGLFPVLKKHFAGKATRLDVDVSDGYYISRDASALLLIVRPKRPAQDLPFSKALMAEVRGTEAAVRGELAADDSDGALKHLSLRYGGGYPIAQSDFRLIMRDAVVNTVSSLALVLFIYLWAFRRKTALAYGWVPLLFGMLVTFGVVHLLGVTINSATAGYGAILIGLGIDFPTVLYGRYIEERNRGVAVREAIASVMGNTGPGIWVGALTTATTFGVMLFTHFPGTRQVGLLTACGILFCALSVFLLLPAMLYSNHLRTERKGMEPEFRMHVFGLDKLGKVAHEHPRATLWITGALTVGLAISAAGIGLDDNVQNLRSKSNEGMEASMEVARTFGASLTYMMALVDGRSPDEVVEKSERVVDAVQPYVKRGEVLFTDAISTYLPPESRQREVMARLAQGSSGDYSVPRIRKTFVQACEAQGFEPGFFTPYLTSLQDMLGPKKPVSFEDLKRGSAGPIVSKFLVEKGPGHYRGVIYLYIPDEYKRFEPEDMVRAVSAAVPGAKVVGINRLSQFLRNLVERDAAMAFILGTLLVLLIVALDFKSLSAGFYSLVPLLAGLVWMLGTLRLLGEKLNIMNIFVTTMIIGIGSDYGIYFVHRYMEDDGHDMLRVIRETGKPIVIAALTTIAGFGSMSLSSYPGLRSMGYVSLLGTLYCMVATLTVLVAILTVREGRHSRDGSGGGI